MECIELTREALISKLRLGRALRLGFPGNSGASTNTSIRAYIVSGLTRGVREGLRGGISTSKSLSRVLEVRKELILLRSFSIVIDRSYSKNKRKLYADRRVLK